MYFKDSKALEILNKKESKNYIKACESNLEECLNYRIIDFDKYYINNKIMNERYVFHLKEKIEIYNPVFRKTDIIYKNIDKIKYFDLDLKNLTKEEAMFLLKYFSKNGVLDIFI